MKKGTGKFKQVEETIHVCDECKTPIDILKSVDYDCTWSDGYDSYGERYEFCSMNCLHSHIKNSGYHESHFFPGGELVTLQIPSEIMKTILTDE